MVLIITLSSVASISIIYVISGDKPEIVMSSSSIAVAIVIVCIDVIQVLIVISMSVRLVQKINIRLLDIGFLIQSIISTTIMFANLYLLLSLVQGPGAFRIPQSTKFASRIWLFLLFSITVQSTTGYGDVWAVTISAKLLVSIHMVISTLYAVAIVGLGISRIMSSTADLEPSSTLKITPLPPDSPSPSPMLLPSISERSASQYRLINNIDNLDLLF
eukprot:CRZ01692.1 hypothetical protein [Spongospora subterranea]